VGERPNGAGNINATLHSASTTQARIIISIADSGAISDQDFTIMVQKQGADFKMPTVQPILVNQVETGSPSGKRIESCGINLTGPVFINSESCNSWLSSVTRSSAGVGYVDINAGVFSQNPDCVVTSASNNLAATFNNTTPTSTRVDFRLTFTHTLAVSDGIVFIKCEGKR